LPTTKEIFEKLRPIEKFVDFPINPSQDSIRGVTENDRKVYKNYIGPEIAKISEIIGTKWKAKLDSASAPAYGGAGGFPSGFPGGGMPASAQESEDLVRWQESSQQELLGKIVPWYPLATPPTVLDIYYSQEDIWLLTGIMEIIKAANGSALGNKQTIVREIEWIRMGREASRDAGSLLAGDAVGGGGGGGGGAGGYGGGGPPGGYAGGGGGMSPGGYGNTQGRGSVSASNVKVVSPDPAEGRYISFATGAQFQQRKATDLRASIKNVTAANAVDAIAKRVPIRLRLKVDPARLPTLIAQCGNAKMMLEVYQVRLNTAPAEAAGSGGGGGGSGEGAAKPMASAGGGAGSSATDGSVGSAMPGIGAGGGDEGPSEVTVEIFGLIYLYNPVNVGTLRPESAPAAAGAPQGGVAPAVQPPAAGTTPAPVTPPPAGGAATPVPPPEVPETPAEPVAPLSGSDENPPPDSDK
jgi:hypothetical protein